MADQSAMLALGEPLAEHESKREELRAQGVRYCLAAYTDVHGVSKAKCVPLDHFDSMMRGSELFTGSALDGLGQEPSDDELSVRPDVARAVQLPWRPELAWCPGYLAYHGEPWPMCGRVVLQRAVDRAAALGYRFNLGIETEFYLVRREDGEVVPANPADVLEKACYDIVGLLENMPFMDEVVEQMNALGWDVHSFDHEDSNSQFEFDFSYTDAMSMADRQTLWRLLMKETAASRLRGDVHAEALLEPNGNRRALQHVARRRRLGREPVRRPGRSARLRRLAPCVRLHGRRASPRGARHRARLPDGQLLQAPDRHGLDDRVHLGAGVRLVRPQQPHAHAASADDEPRVESRAVDATANPYLAAAAYLHAGLEGIEQGLDPGEPIDRNMYLLDREALAELGVTTLPRTLLEAIESLAADPLAETVLSPELKQAYVELKTAEWWEYHNAVSAWEIDRYLTFF